MLRSLFAVPAALLACSGDSFVQEPPGGGTGGSAGTGGAAGAAGAAGAGGASPAAQACLDFSGFRSLDSGNCTNCINDVCKGGQFQTVCPGAKATCIASCGNDAACFCPCMTSKPSPCGPVASDLYVCLAAKCRKECD